MYTSGGAVLWAILNSFYVYECGIITELSSKLPKALCVDGGKKREDKAGNIPFLRRSTAKKSFKNLYVLLRAYVTLYITY